MDKLKEFYKNKKILITGHTGFKGIWLTSVLSFFNANIIGFSIKDEKSKNFNQCVNKKVLKSYFGNVQDYKFLEKVIKKNRPEIIFHLAAQSLVIDGYKYPLETFRTNVLGTLNLLDICKNIRSAKSVVIVTSDKCYKNFGKLKSYKESDELGGVDPYSASKAGAEIISDCYLKSFFSKENIGLATVRAGNVIGGGDWSKNRIVPDCIRSIYKNNHLILRNPNHIRPWQHVLDPINGYLILAMKLFNNKNTFSGSWNFGPDYKEVKSVRSLVNLILKKNNKKTKITILKNNHHESSSIRLNSSKSRKKLLWRPKYNFQNSVDLTYDWYIKYLRHKISIIPNQIKNFYKVNI
jgi:CDP-glucose 4,6-dehydratase